MKELSYDEWKRQKLAAEKKRTHGAEKVLYSDPLHDIQGAIRRYCFNKQLELMPIYFIPPDLKQGNTGLYGYGCIMIDKEFYEDHGTDDDVINIIYHEMIHAYNDTQGIQDTDGDYHLKAFADACAAHCGRSTWTSSQDGYNAAELNAGTLKKVKAALRGIDND